MTAVRSIGQLLLRFFSSFGLSVALLVLLGLLTFLGTLAQVDRGLYDVQKSYFESLFLVHYVGGIGIPLPGGNLVLGLLAVNLVVGGLWRLRNRKNVGGIVVVHIGILMLFAAGLVKLKDSDDGHTTLYEGDEKAYFQSYHVNELALLKPQADGRLEVRTLDALAFESPKSGLPVRVPIEGVPFDLEVTRYFINANVRPKGPMFNAPTPVIDGVFADPLPQDAQNERNGAAAYVDVIAKDGTRQSGLVWIYDTAPWTFTVGGETYALDLRRKRFDMPFRVKLEEFRKEDHPRTGMPRWFSSDVAVQKGATSRLVTISMNEPLREDGLVLYQASWGPSDARPGDRLFSTLAVVRNPSDQWPLYACIVIAVGLVWHFGRKLIRHLSREVART
ncbi:MAG: hypothetical protein GC161_04470 [Planctomycetaceae bacterium]|nr:hypothetical protein [Planctomycetaceae bacterium]